MATKSPRFKARPGKRRPHRSRTHSIGHAAGSTPYEVYKGRSIYDRESNLHRDEGRRVGYSSNPALQRQALSTLLTLPFRFVQRMGFRARIAAVISLSLILVVAAPAAAAVLIHDARSSGSSKSALAASPAYSWNDTTDAAKTISVYNLSNHQVLSVSLNQYILNVLATQMPPTAPMASLQAASVVIRTYATRAMKAHSQQQGAASQTGSQQKADVTTSGVTDLQWLTDSQQQSLFGSRYAADTSRLRNAVSSTDGLILSYQSKPIDAFLTRVSTGETRSGKQEFSAHPPYLVSIKCPADPKAPDFESRFTFTKVQLAQMLGLKPNEIGLKNLKVKKRDKQGYSTLITDGNRVWTGSAFAAKLDLPSSAVTFHVTTGKVQITTKGIGNGYGISLNQAQAWAKSGMNWQAILHKFYPGTKINPSSI